MLYLTPLMEEEIPKSVVVSSCTVVAHAPSPSSPLSPSFVHHLHFVLFSLEKRSQHPCPCRRRKYEEEKEQRSRGPKVGAGFLFIEEEYREEVLWANAVEENNCGEIGYIGDDARLRLCQGSMRPTLLVCIQNLRCSARTYPFRKDVFVSRGRDGGAI